VPPPIPDANPDLVRDPNDRALKNETFRPVPRFAIWMPDRGPARQVGGWDGANLSVHHLPHLRQTIIKRLSCQPAQARLTGAIVLIAQNPTEIPAFTTTELMSSSKLPPPAPASVTAPLRRMLDVLTA